MQEFSEKVLELFQKVFDVFGKTLEAKQTQNHRMTNLQKLLKRS
jgi:hypothetical protein